MYTAKSLTYYRNTPEALSQPPEGPNSGYLVIQDDESTATRFFGLCKDPKVEDLPFPQNKLLTVRYSTVRSTGKHNHEHVIHDDVYLIPVINQPLSSNLYYAIKADGRHKGEVYASSKEEDITTYCCGIRNIEDAKPRSFNSQDIYQQFQFSTTTPSWIGLTTLLAKSFAPNGHPPKFLRRKGWTISGKTPRNFTLGEVSGLNPSLRVQLPEFNFPISQQCSTPVVVGTWYCPFMFIIEGSETERIKNSVFYEMTLEQRWERVFSVDNNGYGHANKVVTVDTVVQTEVVRIGGQVIEEAYMNNDSKVMWFKNTNGEVGLSELIVDRMMWEEDRVGWVKGKKGKEGKQVRVVKEEVYEGVNGWRSFGCYVLVESFVLKRNNGSILMTYDFMHTHQIRSKWE